MRRAGFHSLRRRSLGACLAGSLGVLRLSPGLAAPLNDDFTNATVLTALTNSIVSNTSATFEPGEPLHAGSAGGKSLWWSWQATFTGTLGVSTAGSSYDTLLAVYTGDSVSNLQAIAANDDAGGFGEITSWLVFRAIAGETYHIAVDGYQGATGTVQLAIFRAGRPAPEWSILDLDGNPITSRDFTNRVLVIDFWETTCGACVEEIPHLKRLHTNLVSEGITFLGVSMDPPTVAVRSFVNHYQIPYLIGLGNEAIDSVFGPGVPFPTKFLIDRENMLVAHYSIGIGADYNYYAGIIKPLLRGSSRLPLSARKGTSGFVLAWPANEFGYHLESKAALDATNWTASPFLMVTTNNENTVTVPSGTDTQFFRLQKTPAP